MNRLTTYIFIVYYNSNNRKDLSRLVLPRHLYYPLLAALLSLLISLPAHSETSITGYASIVAGKVIDGDAFLADYPKTGIYDQDISFSPDTSFGIQFSNEINDEAALTIQLTMNGASEYKPDINWAYLNYRVNSELSVQLGRKLLPLYYYSDFFDVGFAYYWIRPPVDNYTWQITNYNGINLLYETNLQDWDISVNVYTGREDSEDNELLGFFNNSETSETWKNMLGLVTEASLPWAELRISILKSQLDRIINDISVISDTDQIFKGVSLNFYPGNFTILSEYNHYRRDDNNIDVVTHMISLGYTYKEYTPHITHSSFKQDINSNGGDENHATTSYGLRWYLNSKTALKAQYDIVDDKGLIIPTLGDSKSVSFGIDVIF